MLIASKLIAGGHGLAAALVRRAATVELDWDTRQKSRFDALDSVGRAVGVFLQRGRVVRGGDVLVAEDGSLILVRARPEKLLVVRARADGTPLDLLRAAYHLGNRHVPLQLCVDRLQLEPDHVLAELMLRMGLRVDEEVAAFEPEAGAYDMASTRHSSVRHEHEHEHEHEHGHRHPHEHGHGHRHGHEHGPSYEHEHEHEHGAGR
ncbi:MAG TPA: urease accessory protein UreE [Caldimonas sp.]|jgi:urease accessory protein|nr:urease accessory protein UreE [Caldimonas sp.]HEX2540319.1 urease accessory protein UreE [Caldimonas sp.]